jgi:hypothetical protein
MAPFCGSARFARATRCAFVLDDAGGTNRKEVLGRVALEGRLVAGANRLVPSLPRLLKFRIDGLGPEAWPAG